MVPMSRLKSVTTLIVSGTEFNRTSLDMVVDDLPLLERIDISCTKVGKCRPSGKLLFSYANRNTFPRYPLQVTEYSALRRIRHRLKHLDAHDVKISQVRNKTFYYSIKSVFILFGADNPRKSIPTL